MSEQKLQKKCNDKLEAAGWYIVKIIQATKAGIPDTIACTPKGKFVGIEYKNGNKGIVARLQQHNLDEIKLRNGQAYVVRFVADIDKIIQDNT